MIILLQYFFVSSNNQRIGSFLSALVFLEAVTSFFFFTNKIFIFYSLTLIVTSSLTIYFLNFYNNYSHYYDGKFNSALTSNFKGLGLSILALTIILELFVFDGNLSIMSSFCIFFSLFLFSYEKLKIKKLEKDFLLVFFSLLFFTIITPLFFFKLGYLDNNASFWYSSPYLVEILLAKPLANILSFLGYVVYNQNDMIFFTDTEAGLTRGVIVGEGCSGLHSISIFLTAYLSYIIIFSDKLNLNLFLLGLVGIVIAYIANMIRMSIIVLSGHYYGYEMLLFVHQNLGGVIFILWTSIFWLIFSKLEKKL